MNKTIKKPSRPEWEDLKGMTSRNMSNAAFRNMLDNAHPGCYVETPGGRQGGTIEEIIRDRYGMPACFKVRYPVRSEGEDTVTGIDYIPVDRIHFYEPYSFAVPNDAYDWELDEATKEYLLENGYRFDEETCCYIHDQTGDVVCW